jgi:hypothetical protein
MSERPFETPEILDVTEVEKAKIHEAGETERAKIRETEETRRSRHDAFRHLTNSDGFYVALVVVPIVFIVATGIVIGTYVSDRYGKPDACTESFDTLSPSSDRFSCTAGASLETTPAENGKVHVHCVCGKAVVPQQ